MRMPSYRPSEKAAIICRAVSARSSAATQSAERNRCYLLRVAEKLSIYLPPQRPVVVLAGRQLSGKDGDCCVDGRNFRIRVSKELPMSQAIDTLLHEWAHALSWDACVGKVANSRSISDYEFEWLAHGPKWGIAYSKVYLCFTFEIEPRLQVENFNAAMLADRRSRRSAKGGGK